MTAGRWADELVRLSQEREALLRIAALAADGSGPDEVFEAVAAEAAACGDATGASLIRFDAERVCTVVGGCAGRTPVGTRIAVGATDKGVIAQILRTERAPPKGSRHGRGDRELPDAFVGPQDVSIPLTVDGRLWGVLQITTGGRPPSPASALGLRSFARLVTTAVANADARAQRKELVDERASLRRIHAVAGRGGTGADVLAAIAAEGSAWLDGLSTTLVRLEDDGTSTELASSGRPQADEPSVRAAITIGGRPWGAMVATSSSRPMPPHAEQRLARFAEAITPTILSAQARTQLADEQSALRRVAELVARGVGAGVWPDDVFALVVLQASKLTRGADVCLSRREGADSVRVIAAHGVHAPAVGTLLSAEGRAGSVVSAIRLGGAPWGLLSATPAKGLLPAGAEHLLNQFADLAAAAVANARARAQIQELADEQAALRRVAEVAARDAPTDEILAAVALEASTVANVEYSGLFRHNPDGSTEIVALHGAPEGFFVGMRAPGDSDGKVLAALHSGQHARVDDLTSVPGSWPDIATRSGFTTGVGVPISMNGVLWGALFAAGREVLSAATEEQLTRFAELAGVAMSAAEARRALRMLAEAQAALSRVAALVARGAALDEVFTAVATEASHLVEDDAAVLVRLDTDSSFVVVAAANSAVPLGFRGRSHKGALLTDLVRSGFGAPTGSGQGMPAPDAGEHVNSAPTVAVPITVEGRMWGALTVGSRHRPVPDDTDQRLRKFAELAGVAIANAENKANLTASRARVVAAADEARRRLQRDVHDTAQQRLVHTILTLKLARQAIAAGTPPDALVEEALLNAEQAGNELRDIVRGILPAALTRGGLRLGLESLASDMAIPVDLSVSAPRFSTDMEQTAYLIVAEALTNVAKHAHAGRAAVSVDLDGDTLTIEVRDDGIGGADRSRGTGLIGLADRVDAVEGLLTLTSPPGLGTTLLVRLPVRPPQRPHR